MNPGELNQRIIVQKLVTNTENGYEEVEYENYRNPWSKVAYQLVRESATSQEQPINIIKCIIRYLKDIDRSMRIIFQGKTFSLFSIDNTKYGRQYMEVSAIEILPKQCVIYRSVSGKGDRNRPLKGLNLVSKYSCTILKKNINYIQGTPNATISDIFNLFGPANMNIQTADIIEVDSVKYIANTPFQSNEYQTEVEIMINKDV